MIKSSDVQRLLESTESCDKLKAAIQDALPEYKEGVAIKGGIAPIRLAEDGSIRTITNKHVMNLCGWYLSGQLDVLELEYIADLIEMGEDFECNEDVREAIFLLANPDINGLLSFDAVKKIMTTMINA